MHAESPPYRVKETRFASGERCPVIVDQNGILACEPNLYGLQCLRGPSLAVGTMDAQMRAVVLLLNWAFGRDIDLEARIASVELLSGHEIVDLRDALRTRRRGREHSEVVTPSVLYARCKAANDYLSWRTNRAIERIRSADPKLPEARLRFEAFKGAMMNNLPKPRSQETLGLDERAKALFLEAIHPDSELNPFQRAHRHRNYALMLLYFEVGLRRGEALVLKGEHLIDLEGRQPTVRTLRAPDDPADVRRAEPRVKTLPRDNAITHRLASALLDWVLVHRRDEGRYPGAKRCPYVFVSRSGQALSLRSVNHLFLHLAKRVPALKGLHPHVLRHTANDDITDLAEVAGWKGEITKQVRNYRMGWSKTSNQGDHYSRRSVRKKVSALVIEMQRRDMAD